MIDCSGSPAGRHTGLRALTRWGRLAFVGEGGEMSFDVSHDVIHNQLTLIGSWVSSIGRMTELVERLPVWGLHPQLVVTHQFNLDNAQQAYRLVDEGRAGKVALVPA